MTTGIALPRCPVEVTLTLIADRWKVLILRELLYGTRRFGEIRKALGNISTKVLTANLRSMEEDGLLTRHVYPEVPPKVEYTLTELGYSLKTVLFAMSEWGSSYKRMVEGHMPIRTSGGNIVLIMKAEQSDVQEITELQNLSVPTGNPTIIKQEHGNGFFLKAMDEQDNIVGAIGSDSQKDTLHITQIVVHPNHQHQGLGTKLIEEVEREYPHHSFRFYVKDEMENISGFLEHCGYKKFSRQESCTVYQKNM